MTYVPDAQDALIHEADRLGGEQFVHEVQYDATEVADRLCPWDRTGQEPPLWVAVWLDTVRQLVDC
ncbi:MAG: hypothetical protein JO100_05245 [Pseudonocardia sp.]|nr:hypothetical protein [Pseudonocardia sp.]